MLPKCEVVKFNVIQVINAIMALKSGKGAGRNKLQDEHF